MHSASEPRRTISLLAVIVLILAGATSLASPTHAEEPIAPVREADGGTACIETGYRQVPLDEEGIAPGPFCFNNGDPEALTMPRIAPLDTTLDRADLEKVEDTSPLAPQSYLAQDTFAAKKLTGDEPTEPYSAAITRSTLEANTRTSKWVTGANIGWESGGQENIPILSVDSSNSYQQYVEVVSRDGRVTRNAENMRIMTGPVPIPSWYLKKPGWSGDRSVMVYDTATGISRSMFYLVEDAPAQTYTTTARFVVSGTASAPTGKKLRYPVTSAEAGKAAVSRAPTSDDLKSTAVETMQVPRSARFRLADTAPAGASVNSRSGRVTLTAPVGAKAGTVINVPLTVSYPAVYHFSSGGYIPGEPGFQGLGEDDYWLTLRSGTSSVVGMQNELTQIGVEEIRAGRIDHAISMTWHDYARISSFPAKMADGSMSPEAYPHAPRAGERLTFPADFDVDTWVDQNRPGDDVMRMILRAAQEYGIIITDRNLFINAFNFESPAGYAPYAREGKNVYVEDPEIAAHMADFHPYSFPLGEAVWISRDFAEDPAATGTKEPSGSAIVFRDKGREVYAPSQIHSTVYADEEALRGPLTDTARLSPDLTYHHRSYRSSRTDGGSFSTVDTGFRFIPAAGWTGETSAVISTDWYRLTRSGDETAQEGYYGAISSHLTYDGTILIHTPGRTGTYEQVRYDPAYASLGTTTWNVRVVPRDAPIAREDTLTLRRGGTATADVLANDESSFGAGIDAKAPRMTDIVLLDRAGKEVTSYSDGAATYRVVTGSDGRDRIEVKAGTAQGFTPTARYVSVSEDGVRSAPGMVQVVVGG